MMNKSLIQSKIRLPLFGEVVCLSKGLIFNIELILFRGPFSPFENNWHLKEEFKRSNKRSELASQLSKQIMWVALANALMSPLIFLWQLIYFFFSYAPVRHNITINFNSWFNEMFVIGSEERSKSAWNKMLVTIWKALSSSF